MSDRRTVRWMSCAIVLCLILGGWIVGSPVAIGAGIRGEGDVLAAASGRHVYVVRPGVDESGWEVVHLDARIGPTQFRTVFRTPRRPEAISATGDRCLLVLAPQDATRPTPLVLSFRVSQHPLNDVWFADPPGDPRVLPPLPGGGELAGLTSVASGDLIVHRPSQRVARGVARTGEAIDADVPDEPPTEDAIGEGGAVHLLAAPARLEWEAIPPPASFTAAVGLAVGRSVADGEVLPTIFWRSSLDRSWMAAWTGDGWRAAVLDQGGAGRPVSVIALDGRTLLAVRGEGGGMNIVDLVPVPDPGSAPDEEDAADATVRARPFATIDRGVVGSQATMVGTEGGPWVIGLDGHELRIATVDRVDGSASPPVVPTEQDVGGSLVEYPVYAGLVFIVMMATFLLRPHIERQPGELVDGLVPAGLLRRAAGLCVDLAPGLMLAIVIFDLDPATFAEDLRAGAPKAVMPGVFAMVVASLITIALEAGTGRSLGKRVVGTRVAALDGAVGTPWQRGLRAALRLVLLLFWPIAILSLLESSGRGMPELLTRTVVLVGRRPAPPAGGTIDLEA